MSAKADALRFPGKPASNGNWYVVVLAVLAAVAVAVTLVLVPVNKSTTTDSEVPNSVSHAGNGAAVAPATHVLQVGGTSVYRYHPLPGVNTVYELAKAASTGTAVEGAVTVGGTGAYRYHRLP